MRHARRVAAVLLAAIGIVGTVVAGPAMPAGADTLLCGHAAGGAMVHGRLPLPKSKCTFYGPGTLTIASDGSAFLPHQFVISSDLRYLNDGVTSTGYCDTEIDVQDTSVLENAASFTNGGCGLTIKGPTTATLINDAGASFVARGSTGIQIPTTNNGFMLASNRPLYLDSLTNLQDGVLTGGSYQATGKYGSLYLPSKVVENDAEIVTAGRGTLTGPGGTGAELSGLRTNAGHLALNTAQPVGALTNTGSLDLDVDGAVSATGALTLDPAGSLGVAIGSDTRADKIDASGPITVGGALHVDTEAGFSPVPGRVYTVAASDAGVSGTFSSVSGLTIDASKHYVLTYGPTSVTLQVDAGPIPLHVYSVSPDHLGQNASNVTMTVKGTGFKSGALVGFGGTDVVAAPSKVIDNTTLTVSVSVSTKAALGAREVKVRNPGSGGAVASCSGCLTITPHPDPTAVSGPIGTNVQGATLTLDATDVQYNAQVIVYGHPNSISASFQPAGGGNEGPLVLTVPADTPLGSYGLRLVNPDHGSGLCRNCLTVVAAPTVTGVSPNRVIRGSTQSVTITGSGFTDGATPTGPIGVSYSAVSVVDANTITATMTVSGSAAPGPDKVITVTNGPAGGFGVGTFAGLTIV